MPLHCISVTLGYHLSITILCHFFKKRKKQKAEVRPVILRLFCLLFLTFTMSAWVPFHRKALVCNKMLFLSLYALLMWNTNLSLCLFALLAITLVSLLYFNRLHFTHLVPAPHPTKILHLLMAHCPLTLYPQVNSSLVCRPQPRFRLIRPLYSVPASPSSRISHSFYPDSTVN